MKKISIRILKYCIQHPSRHVKIKNFLQLINYKPNSHHDNLCITSSFPTLSCQYHSVNDIEFRMGRDKIPGSLVPECVSVLATPLPCLYNLSLQTSFFPDIFKNRCIILIYKKCNTYFVENFRSVTINNYFPKALKITLHQPKHNHIRNIVTQIQHGFMRRKLTITFFFCIP